MYIYSKNSPNSKRKKTRAGSYSTKPQYWYSITIAIDTQYWYSITIAIDTQYWYSITIAIDTQYWYSITIAIDTQYWWLNYKQVTVVEAAEHGIP